jgi:hypothetical protein
MSAVEGKADIDVPQRLTDECPLLADAIAKPQKAVRAPNRKMDQPLVYFRQADRFSPCAIASAASSVRLLISSF